VEDGKARWGCGGEGAVEKGAVEEGAVRRDAFFSQREGLTTRGGRWSGGHPRGERTPRWKVRQKNSPLHIF
jgi:hypothetical protein